MPATPPARRPTMGDVAARAGVSLKSVSRVVNAEAHVSPALAHRVQQAIAELGYRPDRRARDLATAASSGRLIGYVQVDAANPFFAAVYRGLEDVTREHGLLIIAGSTDADPARETALIDTLIESRVNGLVVAGAEGSDDLLRREIEHGSSVVCVDRLLSGVACDTVVSSNRASTTAAVRHLAGVGHRRIAFIGGDHRVWTAKERQAGYRTALREADVGADPGLQVMDVADERGAGTVVRRLLDAPRPPTAVFTAQDRLTAGVVKALHGLGRQHEVALFGFDEIPFSEELDPSVSVVAQKPYEMGRRAGLLLLERMSDRKPAVGRQHVLDAPLRHRRSGSIRPSSASGPAAAAAQ